MWSEHAFHPRPASPSSLRPSFRFVEGEDEFGSDAFRTDHVDVLVMGVDNLFDDRQSQPGAFAVFSAGGVDLVKSFPDLGKAFFRYSDSGVFHGDEYLPVFFRRLYGDR